MALFVLLVFPWFRLICFTNSFFPTGLFDFFKALLCVDVKLAIRIYNLAEKQNNPAYLSEKQAPF